MTDHETWRKSKADLIQHVPIMTLKTCEGWEAIWWLRYGGLHVE
jgi:hypothetical protein